jgi:plasmid stabilization system protein ParE
MNIKILPSAMDDLRRGYLFYESQEVGLGDYFQDSLFSDIDSLILYAGIHRMISGYYRCFSKRFPYAIYYQMEEANSVLVYRILDMRQNPAKTAKSLKG